MQPATKPIKTEEWVVVATFAGATAEIDADLCVTTLEGHGIPALRLPTHALYGGGGLAVRQYAPIRVLLPPEREAEAKELLADATIDTAAEEEE